MEESVPRDLPVPTGLSALVHLGRPSREELLQLRAQAARSPLSYVAVGATIDGPAPEGYRVSGREGLIGRGEAAWKVAKAAVDGWTMFCMPWIEMPPPAKPHLQQDIVFASQQLGFWSLHSCRVVRLVDEPHRYGFAYGTLATHAISGEELFLVERRGDEVFFVIRKFAQPNHLLIQLTRPYSIWIQRQFDGTALECMRRAVQEAS